MEEKLAKYFSGEATEQEIKEIKDWRSANESNSLSYFKAKNIWIQSTLDVDVNTAMLNDILSQKENDSEKIIPIWRNNLMKIAASVLVVLGLSFILYQTSTETSELIGLQDASEHTLPDGSTVILQKGAKLVIGEFGKTRNVFLTGKAYFDVERDESHPFIITSENAKVEVLGTSFVVDTKKKEEVEVLVESGLVALSDIRETTTVKLAKGEMGALNNSLGVISKKSIVNKNYLAWKTKALIFDGSSLNRVAEVVNDVYDVELVFKNSHLGNCKLNGQYKNKTAKEVVAIIAQTFGITPVWKGENQVVFDGNGCD